MFSTSKQQTSNSWLLKHGKHNPRAEAKTEKEMKAQIDFYSKDALKVSHDVVSTAEMARDEGKETLTQLLMQNEQLDQMSEAIVATEMNTKEARETVYSIFSLYRAFKRSLFRSKKKRFSKVATQKDKMKEIGDKEEKRVGKEFLKSLYADSPEKKKKKKGKKGRAARNEPAITRLANPLPLLRPSISPLDPIAMREAWQRDRELETELEKTRRLVGDLKGIGMIARGELAAQQVKLGHVQDDVDKAKRDLDMRRNSLNQYAARLLDDEQKLETTKKKFKSRSAIRRVVMGIT